VIYTSRDVQRVYGISRHLAQIDLGVTVRRARDTFREQISAILIEWLVDLTRCYIYGNDGMTIRQLIASRLFDKREKSVYVPAAQVPNSASSRLEWLFYFHTRLWKRPRFRLKDLYITILGLSHEHKIAMGM
jgi:E3 ubiquitin-protein ligase UBR1